MSNIARKLTYVGSPADPYAGINYGNDLVLEFNTYLSSGTTVSVPIGNGGTVNATVDWGDGSTIETWTTGGAKSHTYSTDGIYVVRISGTLQRLGTQYFFDSTTARPYFTRVVRWGSTGLTSLINAFKGNVNFVSVPNTLPATCTTLNSAFSNCTNFNSPNISSWSTSQVTSLANTFSLCTQFNQSLSAWNTGNVTSMDSTFFGCDSLDQSFSNWNVSKVTTFNQMFGGCELFNNGGQSLSSWTINTTPGVNVNMELMFVGAYKFNQPVGGWDTSRVQLMNGMFNAAYEFNQPLNTWNTSNVTNMANMFLNAYAFNQPLSNWYTTNVTSMAFMFSGTVGFQSSFNQPLARNGNLWNTANVTDMAYMFAYQQNFNQNLTNWCLTNIATKPTGFDTGCTAWAAGNKPVWGTCP